MDPNKLTIKSQAALQEAHAQATARNHQSIEPEHVLMALLGDPDGIVYPLLDQLNVTPGAIRSKTEAALDRIPSLYRRGRGPTAVAGHIACLGIGRERSRGVDR